MANQSKILGLTLQAIVMSPLRGWVSPLSHHAVRDCHAKCPGTAIPETTSQVAAAAARIHRAGITRPVVPLAQRGQIDREGGMPNTKQEQLQQHMHWFIEAAKPWRSRATIAR